MFIIYNKQKCFSCSSQFVYTVNSFIFTIELHYSLFYYLFGWQTYNKNRCIQKNRVADLSNPIFFII
ncbi:hypothetical protein M137_2788 [Bacteroides fragilis str. S36L12]|uniref:Transmembrane protein n=1 Tax=Bacteroides fragilis str. S36L11 TaxID=1339327 RepID=A0A015Y944_BACFG|nr:hypothetical protein M136_2279 [Bacteroides fragilis str. S36L11]EYA85489.1 hypothetical protein M137_2788 [Bacteroides fragilis str. S36L12]